MKTFTEQDYQTMHQYLQQQMTEAERRAFEQRLQTEPEWAEELAWLQKMETNYRYLKLRDYIADIHNRLDQAGELDAGTPIVKTFWQTWGRTLSIAASVVLVLGAGWYVWQNNQEVSTPPVAQTPTTPPARISPHPPVESPTVNLSELAQGYATQQPKDLPTAPTELQEAVQAYRSDMPDAAIAALRKQPKPNPDAPVTNPDDKPLFGSSQNSNTPPPAAAESSAQTQQFRYLYLGLSYLKKGEAAQAVGQFKKVKTASLKPTAEWYEALALLQLNQQEEAKRILTRIKNNPEHLYNLEAEELWEGIK